MYLGGPVSMITLIINIASAQRYRRLLIQLEVFVAKSER